MALVCLNFYLERKIHQYVMNSDCPEHKHMELVSVYVSVLRQVMVCVALCVVVCVCVRYRDPVQQSLEVLQQLRETQSRLQEALLHAEGLGEQRRTLEDPVCVTRERKSREEEQLRRRRRREEGRRGKQEEEEEEWTYNTATDSSALSHHPHVGQSCLTAPCPQNVPVSPGRRPRRSSSSRLPPASSSSPLVYSILVEDKKPAYSLRSRRRSEK
ncbi:uncharacterized protein LOC142990798 [Genypterus blacodes]|uniref:uncharacterized protein LOC142990798 n=1 Tax=Genypterus blacodes TaxID=154954 RepID=UPI003F762347